MQKDFVCAVDQIQQWDSKIPNPGGHDAASYLKLLSSKEPEEEWSPGTASVYAVLGNKDKAFEYLEKAYASHSIELVLEIRYPAFDSLRSDPRYADLMRRLGLPE